MKRLLPVVLAFFLLTGCSNNELDRALELREQLQNSKGCTFDAHITADYGDALYEFGMQCQTDQMGDLTFTVTAPQTIAGITGNVRYSGGELTFDDKVLAFELMADEQITPVSAPWILMQTLRGGYLRSCSRSEDGIMVVIDDSYAEDALQLDIWLNEDNIPVSAEILWAGRRIVSLEVSNFTYL